MPVLDVVTRWNSTYSMLERFIKIQGELYAALTDMKVSYFESDFIIAESYFII